MIHHNCRPPEDVSVMLFNVMLFSRQKVSELERKYGDVWIYQDSLSNVKVIAIPFVKRKTDNVVVLRVKEQTSTPIS